MANSNIDPAQIERLCQIKGIAEKSAKLLIKAGYLSAEEVAEIAITPGHRLTSNSKQIGISKSRLRDIVKNAQEIIKAGAPETSTVEEPDEEVSTEEAIVGAIEPETSTEIKDPLPDQIQENLDILGKALDALNEELLVDRIKQVVSETPSEGDPIHFIINSMGVDDLKQFATMNVKDMAKMTGLSRKQLKPWQKLASERLAAESSDVKSALQVEDSVPETGTPLSEPEVDRSVPETGTPLSETGMVRSDGSVLIPTEQLLYFEGNPRFNPKMDIDDLLENIRVNGILEPLIVCPSEAGYQVISGERRRTCAVELKLPSAPCYIRDMTEAEKWKLAWDLQQTIKAFTRMEEARGLYARKKKFFFSDKEVANFIGVGRTQAGKLIALNKLPESVQQHIHEGRLSVEAGYLISTIAFDVAFPNRLGTSDIETAVQERGLVWDFDWSQEPEGWRKDRIGYQEALALAVINTGKSLGELSMAIDSVIKQEQERREAVIKAEKEAAEKAERKRTEQEMQLTQAQTEISLETERRDQAITNYVNCCANFEKASGIELGDIGLKDPANFERITQQGYLDFERFFGPLTPEIPISYSRALRDLQEADENDVFEYQGEHLCRHCGNIVNVDLRQSLIDGLRAEIEKLTERRDSLAAARKELFTLTQEIRSHHNAKVRLEKDLANLQAAMAEEETDIPSETDPSELTIEEAQAKMAELKGQINERLDDVINVGNRILREETDHSKQFEHDLGCARCGGVIKKGEPYTTTEAFENGKDMTYFMHEVCPDEKEPEASEEPPKLVFSDAERAERIGCIGCGQEIQAGEVYDEYVVADPEDDSPHTFYGHDACTTIIEAEDFDLFEAEKIHATNIAAEYTQADFDFDEREICLVCEQPIEDLEDAVQTPDGDYAHRSCMSDGVKSEVEN